MVKQIVATLSLGTLCIVAVVGLTLLIGDAINREPDNESGPGQIVSGDMTTDTGSESESEDNGSQTPTEATPIPAEVRIVMVGDMLMHDRIIDSAKKEDGSYNFDHLFTHVREDVQAADMAIVNQETIMGGPTFGYSGYPKFNTPYELADAEVAAGFDVILHATNHTLDKGEQALYNCMNNWDTKYPEIVYLGVNKTKEDRENIYIYEQNGIKIAVLNYTYTMNGDRIPADKPYLVNLMTKGVSEQEVIADIRKAEELADFTIVCPHWGTEYELTVSKNQTYWTEIFLENGVDLVMGAHPHVIEPVEWVQDEQGNKMLVYYSLGNFVNGTNSTKGNLARRMVGGMADVTIGRNEAGDVVVLEYDVKPLVCHIGEGDAYTVYYLKDYTEEMAKENRICLQDSAFSLQACLDVVHQVWGE